MHVTYHARRRLRERLPPGAYPAILVALESVAGEPGRVAYRVARLPAPASTPDGSNGNVVVVIADGGSVDTVMLRRERDQGLSRSSLNVRQVIRLRGTQTIVDTCLHGC